MENSDKFKSSLENQRGEDSHFFNRYSFVLLHCKHAFFYRLQTRKEIEIKNLLQTLTKITPKARKGNRPK